MSFADEYFALLNNDKKKKKKDEEEKSGRSFADEYFILQNKAMIEDIKTSPKANRKTTNIHSFNGALDVVNPDEDEDVAPTEQSGESKNLFERIGAWSYGGLTQREDGTYSFDADKRKEALGNDDRTWLQKSGLFDDGWQFGDVAKAILGTIGDTAENVVTGVVGMGEKVVDAGAWLGAQSYGGLTPVTTKGAFGLPTTVYTYSTEDRVKAKEEAIDFIGKDLYDEEKIVKGVTDKVLGVDLDDYSVFGEKTDALAQSGGQLLATAGLQAVGVPWWVTTGLTSFGGELENAANNGATFEEAGLSAAISAGAEILTEKISGGIKFGGKTLDDALTKKLARSVSDKTTRTLLKLGMDMTGEGAEEVLSGVMSAVGQKLTYAKEEELTELFSKEEAWESFIGGAILGGVSGGVNTIKSNAQGVDAVTGLTKNEQAVVDKVYKDEIKARETEKGDKLTNKEKKELYDDVLERMDKGYISTDTIEEVLGGDTYRDYKTTVDYEDTLLEEWENLGNKQNATLAEQTRYNELHERKKALEQNSQRNALKSRLSEEVFGMVQSDRLAESYNERGRRSQAFEADLTQYDSKAQETIQKAIDSGILNNTNRTHEFVDLIAKISADKGVPFDFTNNQKLKDSGFAVEGKQVNGFVHNGNITLNIDSAKALQSTVGHEVTHVLEGTELYDALSQSVIEYAKSKGDYQGRFDTLSKLYEGIEGANIDAELTADLVGDYLFSDTDFVKNLSVQNRNVFQKIWDEVKYLCKVATAGSKEARELAKVQKAFEDAYRASGKGMANEKPTADNDIRFSLSEPVEQTKDLMALHNLTEQKLLKSLKLGGLPMPSVAIVKAQDGHSEFGEISLVLPREAIDPKESRNNKLYSGDAWTPTYPRVEYKANDAIRRTISDKIKSLVPYETLDALGGLHLDAENVSDMLNRNDGDVAEAFKRDIAMQYAYLVDTGADITLPVKEADLVYYGKVSNAAVRYFAGKLVNGLQTVELYQNMGAKALMQDEALKEAVADAQNWEVLQTLEPGSKEYTEYEQNPVFKADDVSFSEINDFLSGSRKLFQGGIQQTVDYRAAKELIRDTVDQAEYEKWLEQTFSGIVEKEGIRNNKDYFTPSGNRRSFEALHYEHNLENVIKAMREKGEKGVGGFGGGNIFGAATTEFSTVEEMKQARDRLQMMSEEEYQAMRDEFSNRFFEIAGRLPNDKRSFMATDDAANTLIEAVTKYSTRNGIANYLKRELSGWATYSDQAVDDLIELVRDIRNMPTGYFEAKPQRAVGFDEVGVFVIPNNADVKLKQELLNRGYAIAEYDPTIEGHRQQVVNQFEEYKFSLSNVGEPVRRRLSDIYGSDVKLQAVAPVQDSVQDSVQESVEEPMFPDDMAPVVEDAERFDSLTDADAPPEMEAPYYESQPVTADDPFDNRDIDEVGNRKVKAYMYENPEVKPFFQDEARGLLQDLMNTTKGERTWAFGDFDGYGAESYYRVSGTKRHTSDDIAYLLDECHYTYDQIEKGLNAIIEDNGAENNAVSKRIEFILNDRLMNGYTDFFYGYDVPPNQDYINLINEKQITEYSKEAFEAFMANADEYAPPVAEEVDIAPVKEMPVKETPAEPVPLYENADGQQAMFEEPETPKRITRKELHSGIVDNIKARFAEKGLDFDKVLKKAKNLSTFATVDNTPQRVMEKALGYKEGQILSDITVNQVAQNETEGIKWLNSFTDRKNGLLAQLSKQYNIKPGSKESAAAQMYAEGFYVNETNDIIEYGDAELAKDFPDAQTQANIKGLASDTRIRQIYDDTLAMINESRTRNAYPEIPRLDNYFLHFRAMDDTFSKLGLPFNPNDIRAKDLPTDLNGVTADLKPGQPYFASAMHRTGKRTSFDLLGGLERYLSSAKNQIYHIDDIQTLRALRNYIADTYGQANGLDGLDALSEEEAQDRIEKVYNSHLSTFAKFLNEEANVLAGKTALIDRGLEGILGRRGMTFLDTVNKQVGSNMVGFNISSSLTNFLPVVQTFAKSEGFKQDFVKAFGQTVGNKVGSIFGRTDSFAENSPVVIRRKGADRFYRTPWQKAGDAGYVFMSAVDDISTELIARTKYNELTRKGMDSQKAHYETDKWVSRLMGDRSLGQMPQLYNSKSLGLITKFQLEVRNQLDAQFYDTIQEAKVSNEYIENGLARNAKTAAKVASTFVQLAVVQHLFGMAFESVAGYNPAFDIIEAVIKTFGFDDDEDSEDTVLDNIEQGFLTLLEDLPYTSTFTGGRIPISSALPIKELVKGVDEWGNEKPRLETLGEIAPYYVLPGGYGQIKKTVQGLSMFSDDHPIAGSYTDSGNLRFPVEDTLGNRIQAGIFGQWASKNARTYFDNDLAPLDEKRIQEYTSLGLSYDDYWAYRDDMTAISKRAEAKGASDEDIVKSKYISSVDTRLSAIQSEKEQVMNNDKLTEEQKAERISDLDEQFVDLANERYNSYNDVSFDGDYAKIGSTYYQWYTPEEGESYWRKLTESQTTKYLVTSAAGDANYATDGKVHYRRDEDGEWTKISDKDLARQKEVTKALGITPEEYWSETEVSFVPLKQGEYEYAYENPENYAVAKAVGGYDAYKGLKDAINNISADKDKYGNSISGSKKEKVTEYINGLDLDYGEKIILYRSMYSSKEDKNAYNADIVEYLDSRSDISYEEMVEILEALGMKVSGNTVTW